MTANNQSLPPIPEPDSFGVWGSMRPSSYTTDTLQAYGDARAAHARVQERESILAELRGMTCNNATARSAIKLCIETIKELK